MQSLKVWILTTGDIKIFTTVSFDLTIVVCSLYSINAGNSGSSISKLNILTMSVIFFV